MKAFHLEDFAHPVKEAIRPQTDTAPPTGPGSYEDGYNSGWDDALAQVAQERSRVGDALADRLTDLRMTRDEAMEQAVRALEPMLHEVFDKILPRVAERSFLSLLTQEAEAILSENGSMLTLMVAPEEVQPLESLLASREDLQSSIAVRAEPALSLSQALLSWDGGERRLDIQATLTAFDTAFEDFLARTSNTSLSKEAQNG